jgi:hypothetical protein
MNKLHLMAIVVSTFLSSHAIAGCISDVQCGVGNKCVKASEDINITGICVTPTDEYGNREYDNSMSDDSPHEVAGCSFDTDCDIGFSCLKRSGQLEGICVK